MDEDWFEVYNSLIAAQGWLNRAFRFYIPHMRYMDGIGNKALGEASLALGDACRKVKEKILKEGKR